MMLEFRILITQVKARLGYNFSVDGIQPVTQRDSAVIVDKTRLIRTKNTLLAACGGLLLSSELLFAHFSEALLLSTFELCVLLACFWFVNFSFILAVASGFTERFKDPSLSQPQMYWAMCCSMSGLLLIPAYANLVYILILVITVFGVFQLKPIEFVIFMLFQGVIHAVALLAQKHYALVDNTGLELFVTWLVYMSGMAMLTHLCRAMATLRSKLKARNKLLQDALNARGQFLANMSHEIRTPMNGVLGMLELIAASPLDQNQARYVGVAQSSGQSLLTLINDILDFSKIEASKLELALSEFDLKLALIDFAQSFYLLAQQKGLDFILDIDNGLPLHVVGDQARIRQILNNILGNAVKFTSQGEIYVSAKQGNKTNNKCEIIFKIVDTGCGIPESAIEKIFESFSQADNTNTRQFGGTGLGLAISKKLCEMMNGEILVESKAGSGSTFCISIWLEVVERPVPQPMPQQELFVLVLDKNKRRAEVLASQIESLNGKSELIVASEIELSEVLSRASTSPFTHIFCHESICNDAFPLLDKLRSLPALSKLPIVVCGCGSSEVDNTRFYFLREPIFDQGLFDLISSMDQTPSHKILECKHINCSEPTRLRSSSTHADGTMISNSNASRPLVPVLLVEDNKVNQEVAMMFLADCGLEIDLANNGIEALEMLQSDTPSYELIFMDCQMPELDGYAATRAIRSGEVHSKFLNVPIIAMTANALPGDKEKCLSAGMSDYISKPIDFDRVESKVNHWLDKKL